MKIVTFEALKELIAKHVQLRNFSENGCKAESNLIIVAIDGMSAALKTTTAKALAAIFDGAVIHCDDFFLPQELRTQERLSEPGGNIHYERMKKEVIDKFPDRLEAYTRFDCSVMNYEGIVEVPRKHLYIVEGAYALHPYFGKYYDISIFMKVSEHEQIKRISVRNGNTDAFFNKWIPMEQMYNKSFGIEKNSNIVVDTTDWRHL